MVRPTPTLTPIVYRSPFTLVDGSPTTITSPLMTWNPRDEVIRRFSEPAGEADKLKLAAHVK